MAFGQDDNYGKPVEEGKTYEVTVEDLGSKGDGIARVDGFVVFVPETEVGEKVEVEINSVGRKFAFGEVVDRLGMAEDGALDADAEEAAEEEFDADDDLEDAADELEVADDDEDDLDLDVDADVEDADEDVVEDDSELATDADVQAAMGDAAEALDADDEDEEMLCENCGQVVEDPDTHVCA